MATFYVSSVDGNDADDGSTWALAKATVEGALAAATTTGDIIYIDSAHTYSSAAAIAWNPASSGLRIAIISVNRNGSTATGHSGWLAGAKETVGVNAASFAILGSTVGKFYCFGLTIEGNSGGSSSNTVTIAAVNTSGSEIELESCTVSCPGTSASCEIYFGSTSAASKVTLKTVTLIGRQNADPSTAIAYVRVCRFFASGLSIQHAGATKAKNLFRFQSALYTDANIVDSDLSGFDSASSALVFVTSSINGSVQFVNCKLHSTPSRVSGTFATGNAFDVTFVNCDSADTKINFAFYNRLGTLTQSTSIYAGSGATHDGVAVSWSVVTTAACNEWEPFITPWIEVWGSSISAQTQTIEYVRDSANTMNNRQIWAEFERVSDASFPKGTLLSVRHAEPFDGSGSNWGSGAASWTGTGGSATTGKLSSGSITPAEKSLLRARVCVGVASITDLYIDPKLRIA